MTNRPFDLQPDGTRPPYQNMASGMWLDVLQYVRVQIQQRADTVGDAVDVLDSISAVYDIAIKLRWERDEQVLTGWRERLQLRAL